MRRTPIIGVVRLKRIKLYNLKFLLIMSSGLLASFPSVSTDLSTYSAYTDYKPSVEAFKNKLPESHIWHVVKSDDSEFFHSALRILHSFESSIIVQSNCSLVLPGNLILVITDRVERVVELFGSFRGRIFILSNSNLQNPQEGLLSKMNAHLFIVKYNGRVILPERRGKKLIEVPLSAPIVRRKFTDDGDNTVVLRTFNCSIFSKFGPITPSGKPDWASGLEFEIFKEMMKRLHLDWTLTPSSGFGWIFDNGTEIDGVHVDIRTGKGHVGFCNIWYTDDELGEVDIIQPWFYTCWTFLVPAPNYQEFMWLSLIHACSNWFWLTLFLLASLTSSSIFFISYWRRKFLPSTRRLTAGNSTFLVFTMLCQNNFPKTSNFSGPLRPLFSSWVITCFIFGTCYSGVIFSLFYQPQTTREIKDTNDLVERKCRWGLTCENNLSQYRDLNPETTRRLSLLYLRDPKERENFNISRYECYVELGRTADKVFFTHFAHPKNIYNHYEVLNDCYMGHHTGFILEKGSHLTPLVSRMAQMMREHGIFEKILDDNKNSRQFESYIVSEAFRSSGAKIKRFKKLNLRQLVAAFAVVAIGMSVSFVAFLFEILV